MKNLKFILIYISLGLIFHLEARAGEAVTSDEAREYVKQVGITTFVKEIASTMSANAPQKIDAVTTLISAFANGDIINIAFEVSDSKKITKKMAGTAGWESEIVMKKTKKTLCSSPVSSVLIKEFDVTYNHRYLAKDGNYILSFDVDKDTCKLLK